MHEILVKHSFLLQHLRWISPNSASICSNWLCSVEHLNFYSQFFKGKIAVSKYHIIHCDVTNMMFSYYAVWNTSRNKQVNQPSYQQFILTYLYTFIKRWSGISLHKHVNVFSFDSQYLENQSLVVKNYRNHLIPITFMPAFFAPSQNFTLN